MTGIVSHLLIGIANLARRLLGQPNRLRLLDTSRPLLLEFERPDSESVEGIRRLMEKLEVSAPAKRSTDMGTKTQKGSILEMVAALRTVLEADYEDISRFTEDTVSVRFSYVVHRGPHDPKALDILTRLWNPEEEGAICYGRTIWRISEDEYLLRVDD